GLVVAVVVLERDLGDHAVPYAIEEHGLVVQRVLVLVQELHELDDAALVHVLERLAGLRLGERDREPAVEERELAQARRERVPQERRVLEDLSIRAEAYGRSRRSTLELRAILGRGATRHRTG